MRAEKIYKAAELYYAKNLTQQEIAKQLGISRVTVSRMLARAREDGMVEIRLHRPFRINRELSLSLQEKYNLEKAEIVTSINKEEETVSAVSSAAANLLMELVKDNYVIGVSWGGLLREIVDAMPICPKTNTKVVTLVGSLGGGKPALDGPEIARSLAAKFRGTYRFINAPAILPTTSVHDQIILSGTIPDVIDLGKAADVFLFGVGSIADEASSLSQAGYLSAETRSQCEAQGAVGHLLARMIDENGDSLREFNSRVLGVGLDVLKSKQKTILTVHGAEKAHVTHCALQGGYAKYLVADTDCAVKILGLTK